jgi:hypothetical protein
LRGRGSPAASLGLAAQLCLLLPVGNPGWITRSVDRLMEAEWQAQASDHHDARKINAPGDYCTPLRLRARRQDGMADNFCTPCASADTWSGTAKRERRGGAVLGVADDFLDQIAAASGVITATNVLTGCTTKTGDANMLTGCTTKTVARECAGGSTFTESGDNTAGAACVRADQRSAAARGFSASRPRAP